MRPKRTSEVFFDSTDHSILSEMLRKRIDDGKFLNLIRKRLKADIPEQNGRITDPVTGTPQGGIVSPILADIYLHYAPDEWFEDAARLHCRGRAKLSVTLTASYAHFSIRAMPDAFTKCLADVPESSVFHLQMRKHGLSISAVFK